VFRHIYNVLGVYKLCGITFKYVFYDAGFMKLQKQKAREYKNKPIYKYVIVIPPRDIEELGWKEGNELEGTVIKNKGYFIVKKNN